MKKNTSIRFVAIVAAVFIGTTIIGTVSHECGHWLMAKALGYNASMHFNHTYTPGIRSKRDTLLITAAGPLQTMLTGTIGFALLLSRRKKHPQVLLWIPVFLSLFWLRPVFNGMLFAANWLPAGALARNIDEVKLAIQTGLPLVSILFTTATTGAIIGFTILLKFIPRKQRSAFLLGAILGSLSGYTIWINWLGPVLMP